MLANVSRFFEGFVADESGQGITEYGAILAFVAVLAGDTARKVADNSLPSNHLMTRWPSSAGKPI